MASPGQTAPCFLVHHVQLVLSTLKALLPRIRDGRKKLQEKPEVTLTRILEYTPEYRKVCQKFKPSNPPPLERDQIPFAPAYITRVFKINNPDILGRYQRKKAAMSKRNGQKVKEEDLFHGTCFFSVDSICSEGFRVLSPEQTPHWFGYSVCFARDSSISFPYTECLPSCDDDFPDLTGPPTPSLTDLPSTSVGRIPAKIQKKLGMKRILHCSHYMFLSKVLVGESAQAEKFLWAKFPPPRVRSDDVDAFYDSCEGEETSEGHVAVFCQDQAYPQYLIEFDRHNDSLTCCFGEDDGQW